MEVRNNLDTYIRRFEMEQLKRCGSTRHLVAMVFDPSKIGWKNSRVHRIDPERRYQKAQMQSGKTLLRLGAK
jgi:hypothetical protein